MKKLIALLCAMTLTLSLAACSPKVDVETGEDTEIVMPEVAENPVEDMELADLMSGMLENVVNQPQVGDMVLDETNFEAYAFIPYQEGLEGLVSEAMIGSIAHSVVLIRVEGDAEAVAQEILDNANPRKWICVEAEKVVVRQYGNTIALIMSAEQTANQIVSNFDTLNGSETPVSDQYDPNAQPSEEENPGDMDDMGDNLGQPVAPLPEDDMVLEGETDTPVADIPATVPDVIPEPAPVVTPEVTPDVTPEVVPDVTPEVAPEGETATDLVALMTTIMDGVNMEIMTGEMELGSENFSFFTFIEYVDGYTAVVNEAMMGSQAHSVVLVEVPDGTDVAAVAAAMEANADPRKWICVEAETCQVATNGNYILLVMTYTEYSDAILANFANL